MIRRLRLSFAEAAAFREEYERNIIKGGAFIHTAEEFEPRDVVEIQLDLGFCGESERVDVVIVTLKLSFMWKKATTNDESPIRGMSALIGGAGRRQTCI